VVKELKQVCTIEMGFTGCDLIHPELKATNIKFSLKSVVEKIRTLSESKNRDTCVSNGKGGRTLCCNVCHVLESPIDLCLHAVRSLDSQLVYGLQWFMGNTTKGFP